MIVYLNSCGGREGKEARKEQDPEGGGIILTALLSRYNLQQSMLAPLSRFGSESGRHEARCKSTGVKHVRDVNEHRQM